MLGTDVTGCCLLYSSPFKLSSSVHGVAAQCLVRTSLGSTCCIRFASSCLRMFLEFRGQRLVRTSLVGAYWICFSSSCLRLFMKFQGYVGTDIIGCCLLDALPFHVAFVCSRGFGAMLDTDIIGCCLLDSLPFKFELSPLLNGYLILRTGIAWSLSPIDHLWLLQHAAGCSNTRCSRP